MTQKQTLMGVGTPAQQAGAFIGGVLAAQTATGSAQADAFLITITNTQFTTVAASTGAVLPSQNIQPGDYFKIFNHGANTLAVYPPVGSTIGTGAANAALSLPANKGGLYVVLTATSWGAIVGA